MPIRPSRQRHHAGVAGARDEAGSLPEEWISRGVGEKLQRALRLRTTAMRTRGAVFDEVCAGSLNEGLSIHAIPVYLFFSPQRVQTCDGSKLMLSSTKISTSKAPLAVAPLNVTFHGSLYPGFNEVFADEPYFVVTRG